MDFRDFRRTSHVRRARVETRRKIDDGKVIPFRHIQEFLNRERNR
jgi:hypothetical protein